MNENTLNVKIDGLNSSDLRCYYCNRTVSLVELNKVDADLDAMSEEYGEGVVENLPASRNQKVEPFIHRLRIFDQWFKVPNTCEHCLAKARTEFVRVSTAFNKQQEREREQSPISRARNYSVRPLGFYNK